jgi:IS5 family transposase
MGLERMLRMYIAQQCFGLPDEGIENAICDRQSMRGFVGIDLTTLLKFRRLLEKHRLTRRIFDEINLHLASKGLLMREGRRGPRSQLRTFSPFATHAGTKAYT